MSSSQHRASRCVFVGNIPYDATEEQLVQICEEVGPVVSFRLVVDRETGKPKGYGFCEFRDEETALSARRNLQGYEINGRQLRVDFAENEKGGGVDRNREQGRGGPGLQQQSYGYDAQKQPVSVLTHPGLHSVDNTLLDQPIGYQAATAAASVMAGALGNSQLAMLLSQAQGAGQMNGPSQANGNTDSLTSHLASMSKQQLYEVMLQMKALIQQNQQQARQLLVGNPQLTKALFQAQIMLGMVKPSQGGVTVQSNQQAQAQTSLGLQTNSVLSQQVAPQLQAQPRPAAGVPAQNVQQPLFQSASNQTQQSVSQMQFQGSLPQGQLPIAYQQHGQQLPSQSLTQQAYQQMAANNLVNSASRVGGEMGGVAMLGQGGVSGNTGMLGGNIGMGPQAGRGGLASGIMHHASQSSGNIGNLGGSHLLGSGNLAGGMGMSMVGGPMGNDVNPRIAYVAAGDVHAGNGYGQLQLQAMQQSQLQAQSHRQAQSQSQAQPQSQVQMELEQQKALLQQVLNLTPDQINLLPMEQRQQVIQLQQALR